MRVTKRQLPVVFNAARAAGGNYRKEFALTILRQTRFLDPDHVSESEPPFSIAFRSFSRSASRLDSL